MGRGYSGNHPRFSKHKDERYDAKEAYNKDLTASARLHYLENDRHDHTSPNHMSVNQRLDDSFGMGQNTDKTPSPMNKHTRAHRLRDRAINISERSGAERGDEYDYENPRVQKLLSKANKADERSGNLGFGVSEKGLKANMTRHIKPLPKTKVNDERSGEIRNEMINEMIDERPDSPMNACAKSEGGSGCVKQMGGAWRVISNKTDKPWPAKYASKAKADAALRGYHAG